jgi:hypothetical protein
MICEAILKINPNAKVHVTGDNIDTCKIEWLENTTPISKEDIKKQIPIVEQELKDLETQKANDKISAQNKLKALGLTDAEIEAL